MAEIPSHITIRELQRKWTNQALFANILLCLALAVFAGTILHKVWLVSWFSIPVIAACIFGAGYFFNYQVITEKQVAAFLNRALPDLEESTHLLLRDPASLNLLEQLQVQKISKSIHAEVLLPASIRQQRRLSIILFIGSLLFAIPTIYFPLHQGKEKGSLSIPVREEIKPAGVKQSRITITPPAYLNKESHSQNQFNVIVEEDGQLSWQISTTKAVGNVILVFNDKSELPLHTDNTHTRWEATKKITTAGFYQVKIDSSSSDLYRIDMTKDQYPVIDVHTPKPSSLIEAGHPLQSQLDITATDDYGIKAISIAATIASGNGEAVKFKKQQLVFTDFAPGSKRYDLKKGLNLGALGMSPGDELYFYITATDTRGQEKKSDVFIIRIEDNTQLLSIDIPVNALDIKPELFRSQRQIIIETEQLLKDKDTMRLEDFKKKSNDLGIDQNLLRLRYSKFLGEETNAEIGHDPGHDEHGGHEGAATGNAQEMIDAVSHKHDNAEDASFFDAETKKQLKATLDEMWKAELQLKLFKPKDALPFEYKALKLLKDLQQQTRVFVAKTGSKMPPLKLEKRLTGELDKITQPVSQQNRQIADDALVQRKALGILEQLANKEAITPALMDVLEKAGIQIGNKAAEEPRVYLLGFESFRKILSNQYNSADIARATSVLQKMLKEATNVPSQQGSSADKKLSQQYFINLHRANE